MSETGNFIFDPETTGPIRNIWFTAESDLLHSDMNFTPFESQVPWFLVEQDGKLFSCRYEGVINDWGNTFSGNQYTHHSSFESGVWNGREINELYILNDFGREYMTASPDLNGEANSPDFTKPVRFGIGYFGSTGGGLASGPSVGSITKYTVTIEYAPIPEPSAVALLAAAVLSLWYFRKRTGQESFGAPRA